MFIPDPRATRSSTPWGSSSVGLQPTPWSSRGRQRKNWSSERKGIGLKRNRKRNRNTIRPFVNKLKCLERVRYVIIALSPISGLGLILQFYSVRSITTSTTDTECDHERFHSQSTSHAVHRVSLAPPIHAASSHSQPILQSQIHHTECPNPCSHRWTKIKNRQCKVQEKCNAGEG